jgi:hypothetical protein
MSKGTEFICKLIGIVLSSMRSSAYMQYVRRASSRLRHDAKCGTAAPVGGVPGRAADSRKS